MDAYPVHWLCPQGHMNQDDLLQVELFYCESCFNLGVDALFEISTIITMPAVLLTLFPPAPDALLTLLAKRIDNGMLREIAEADRGIEAEVHFAALQDVASGVIPAPMQWTPKEVLSLIRWSEPDDPTWRPGSQGLRGHRMRAFCCAALLRAAAAPANQGIDPGENQTIVQLLASAFLLGQDVVRAALQFLLWRIPQIPLTAEERPFWALAILLLVAGQTTVRIEDSSLVALADWVVAEERSLQLSDPFGAVRKDARWLLGLTFYQLRHTAWQALANHILTNPQPNRGPEVQTKCQQIARWLAASA